MKGYVELSRENGLRLIKECTETINSYVPEYEDIERSKFLGFGKKVEKFEKDRPYWKCYESPILRMLDALRNMLYRGDTVNLSLTCYNELIKLARNDKDANPVFILNY